MALRDSPFLATAQHGVKHVVGDDRWASAVVSLAGGRVKAFNGGFADVLVFGFGHGGEEREQQAADMLAADDLVVSAELGMSEAVAAILERPEATRYQDILVLAAGSPRIVPVSEVFEGLSDVFRHASMHDPLTGLPTGECSSRRPRP
jgi:hypothetical protein